MKREARIQAPCDLVCLKDYICLRSGEISAQDLRRTFVKALGQGQQSDSTLACIASLLPPGKGRSELLATLRQEGGDLTNGQAWQPVRVSARLESDQLTATEEAAAGPQRQSKQPLRSRMPKRKTAQHKVSSPK